ncbi:MAG: hypothetical protein JWR15_1241 [Prosthecobacter sp.]|nr:hypothetical protein [Prosthecobacter sp.]
MLASDEPRENTSSASHFLPIKLGKELSGHCVKKFAARCAKLLPCVTESYTMNQLKLHDTFYWS